MVLLLSLAPASGASLENATLAQPLRAAFAAAAGVPLEFAFIAATYQFSTGQLRRYQPTDDLNTAGNDADAVDQLNAKLVGLNVPSFSSSPAPGSGGGGGGVGGGDGALRRVQALVAAASPSAGPGAQLFSIAALQRNVSGLAPDASRRDIAVCMNLLGGVLGTTRAPVLVAMAAKLAALPSNASYMASLLEPALAALAAEQQGAPGSASLSLSTASLQIVLVPLIPLAAVGGSRWRFSLPFSLSLVLNVTLGAAGIAMLMLRSAGAE